MNAITMVENNALATTPTMPSPMAGALQMLQAGVSIEQMQGIMALQKEWDMNEARKAYVADMAAFKLNPPEIYKTKLVAFSGTEYMHATLGDVSRAVVDALARHGFSHSWETKQANGLITVNCKITHRLGHFESTSMEAAADQSGKKNAIQAVASAITYCQRYTLLAACGLATMDIPDDDGRGYEEPPPPPLFDSVNACNQVSEAKTSQELDKLWEGLGAKAAAAKDRAGYKCVRSAVEERRVILNGESK